VYNKIKYMEKINLVELLKDCPSGMELDCTVYDNVTFGCIMDGNCYPIQIQTPEGNMLLSEYGCMSLSTHSKCVIFPKGKTTWEGFVPPYKFKDGDVVATNSGHWIGITTGGIYDESIPTYCIIDPNNSLRLYFDKPVTWSFNRLATEEEKQKLFDVIKANGYKWNEEIKTLEKLPKFKVGDRIKYIYFDRKVAKVVKIHDKRYELDNGKFIEFQDENAYEISYDKFDITTLKPFDKVLVRTFYEEWKADFFSHYSKKADFPYSTVGKRDYYYCIPYEGNEHLCGTTNDCDEYYKNWE
jgi:hypothetical protein